MLGHGVHKLKVLFCLTLNYSLQWLLPCFCLLLGSTASTAFSDRNFELQTTGAVMGFLLFRGLLLSSPTPRYFGITNFFIALNPLLVFPSLPFISASFMTSLLFIFQSILNLDPIWGKKIREGKSPLSLSIWRNSQKLILYKNGLLCRN